jgi:hypothetical protein
MDDITFDNIDSSPPVSDLAEEGVEQVPAIPQEKLDNPEPVMADEKEKSKEPTVKKESKKSEKVEDPKPTESEDGTIISINGENYNLAELMENPEAFQMFSQKIKENELRRADYSRKTAELARQRESFESDKQKHLGEVSGYLNELNQVFMETPRLFLLKTLGIDPNGQPLPPEQSEKAIQDWVKKLAGELKMGQEYNPSQLKKQYEMESRLRRMEQEAKEREQMTQKQAYEQDVNKLKDHIAQKAVPKFSEGSPVNTLMEKMPWLKASITNMALDAFNKAYEAEYVEGDPSWDDFRYVDSFNFDKIWSEIEKQIEEVYDVGREKYVERKKAATRKKPVNSHVSAASGQEDKNWTFDDFF